MGCVTGCAIRLDFETGRVGRITRTTIVTNALLRRLPFSRKPSSHRRRPSSIQTQSQTECHPIMPSRTAREMPVDRTKVSQKPFGQHDRGSARYLISGFVQTDKADRQMNRQARQAGRHALLLPPRSRCGLGARVLCAYERAHDLPYLQVAYSKCCNGRGLLETLQHHPAPRQSRPPKNLGCGEGTGAPQPQAESPSTTINCLQMLLVRNGPEYQRLRSPIPQSHKTHLGPSSPPL